MMNVDTLLLKKAGFMAVLQLFCAALTMGQTKVYFDRKLDLLPDSVGASFYRLVDKEGESCSVKDMTRDGIMLSSGHTTDCASAQKSWDYFRNGQYVTFWENGAVKSVEPYKMGVKDGVSANYAESGPMTHRQIHVNGKLMVFVSLYPNGEVEDSVAYAYKGKQVSSELFSFHANGKLARHDTYSKSDKLVEGICYDTLGVKCEYVPFLELPKYQGGEHAMEVFIRRNINYPIDAYVDGREGTVFVECIVSADGKIKGAKVTQRISPLLDAEAIRLVSAMPLWIPGKRKGVPCDMQYVVPVRFKLDAVF